MTHADEIITRLVEKVEHRYWGKYRATVASNEDPEYRARLQLRIPAILGKDVVTGWALPCAPYGGTADVGLMLIPEQNAGVWAEFEGGLLEFPVWSGCWWAAPGGTSELSEPLKTQKPPTSKILQTLKHKIELADADDAMISIIDSGNKNKVLIDKNGIAVEDANGNKLTMAADGILAEDKNGNKVTMAAAGITIEGATINLGDGASEPVVKGQTLVSLLTTLVTALMTHTHVGNLGAPTSPPVGITPPAWATSLSSQSFVK